MKFKHKFSDNILRSYDIRGVVGDNLNDLDAFMLGYFFGLTVKNKINHSTKIKVVVSRDGRLSSKKLENKLISGLLNSGAHVISIGLNPTPTLYFANYFFSCDAAIQITGSHNPKTYNGFKMILLNKSFFGKDIIQLDKLAQIGSNKKKSGLLEKKNVENIYIKRVLEPLKSAHNNTLSKMCIVWDCGNGATGKILNKLIKKLPGNHHLLFEKIDGNFPNHAPDPTKIENLKPLIKKMKKINADLGIAFDGDGDRISVVDRQGLMLPGDLLTAFLALSIEQKNQLIILDVKSSLTAKKHIEKSGFKVEIWKTGHSHIKSRMLEKKSPLAGEMSGHIFFSDKYYGYDDAIYTSIRLLELINRGYSLKKFLSNVKNSFFTPEIKCECSDDKKFQIISNIILKLKKHYNETQLLLIDGIRVTNNHGWYLIRASNTENAIIVRAEGKTKKDKVLLLNEVKSILKSESIFLK